MTDAAATLAPGLLAAVLDRLIPAADGFPSGGAVAAYVADALSTNPDSLELLRLIDARGGERGGAFAALPEAEQVAVLHAVEQKHAVAFAALLLHVYNGYYSDPRVVQALGLPPGPPARRPHHLEPLRASRLDHVAARGPIYKPV